MNGGAGAIEDPDCGKNRMRASGIAPLEWGFNISPTWYSIVAFCTIGVPEGA